jgi:D-3-phosphoglycerate dehydrogenase
MGEKNYKIVYTDNIYKDTDIEKHRFSQVGFDFTVAPSHDEESLIEICRDADGIMVSFAEITGRIIEAAERCKIIVRCGIGVNNIDIAAATKKGIMVANVQKYCADEVSDHVLALMLTLLRRTAYMDRLIKNEVWDPSKARPIPRIKGLTMALYGLGDIAGMVAKKTKAFGFNLIAYDPFVSDECFEKMNVTRITDESELFSRADVLSLHIPLNEKTSRIITYEKIKRMKPSSILINTARGGIVDEAGLIRALQEGLISGAGLDVLKDEYPDMSNPLLHMDNVIVTPHIAYYSEGSEMDLRNFACDQVIGALIDGAPRFFINQKELNR